MHQLVIFSAAAVIAIPAIMASEALAARPVKIEVIKEDSDGKKIELYCSDNTTRRIYYWRRSNSYSLGLAGRSFDSLQDAAEYSCAN